MATLLPLICVAAAVFSNIGPLGVKVFFVISGFVICRLLILEEKRNSNVSLKGFYIRRVFRILPPLYLYSGSSWAFACIRTDP